LGLGTTTPGAELDVEFNLNAGAYINNSSTTGRTFGLLANNSRTRGLGIEGNANASTGRILSVLGFAGSTSGTGVFGQELATSGSTAGVPGTVSSASGIAGAFNNRRR
jgi:hypothetical protein